MPSHRPKVVLLGMMTKMPVAGVVLQTMQYLIGLERLGYDAFYVESHARTPSMLMKRHDDDSSLLAADFLAKTMKRFGLEDRWAFHALHDDGRLFGMDDAVLTRLYREADLIINLHGGTQPLEEHSATGRLVYLETDPVQLQIELADGQQSTVDFLEPHVAFFTFGENLGNADCGLPVPDRFEFWPTRQPVVLDLWNPDNLPGGSRFTTIGNWRQAWRDVQFRGATYHWSKHREWENFIRLPSRSDHAFELALSGYEKADRVRLESLGWSVRDGLDVSRDIDTYRAYIVGSLGELTVAKDQNVRFRSGWFSDRSASYLAAGRPVVTQDTGFGSSLPTGEGLFAFSTLEEIIEATDKIASDPVGQSAAAREVARQCFRAETVLGRMLDRLGLPHSDTGAGNTFPPSLRLSPLSRRPLRLADETAAEILDRPPFKPGGPMTVALVPAVTVIVATYDNLLFSRLCLESLLADTSQPAREVIVVDNGSRDGTPDYLEALEAAFPELSVLRNETNRGFAVAMNQALAVARGEAVVLLNDDTIISRNWLPVLLAHLQEPELGAVCPVTNRIEMAAEIPTSYDTYGQFLALAAARAASRAGQRFYLPMLAMFCLAMRREVVEEIGPLDEGFSLGLFEDDDYAMRLTRAGYRLACAEDVLIHHFGEASLGKLAMTGKYSALFKSNRARFERKWDVVWRPHRRRVHPEYDAVVAGVRAAVDDFIPKGAGVAVVSKGDDSLLELGSRCTWHFPGDSDGSYAGHYPADDKEAIAQLEYLRSSGADFLVFPCTANWWLDHYGGLRDYLAAFADEVARSDAATIYFLKNCGGSAIAQESW